MTGKLEDSGTEHPNSYFSLLRIQSDFMLHEYTQIVKCIGDLYVVKNQMIKFYGLLITIPIGLLAASIQLFEKKGVSIEQTLSLLKITNLPELLVLLFGLIGIFGIIIVMVLVNIRFETLLYSRTANAVRRFYSELDSKSALKDSHKLFVSNLTMYLALPRTDKQPPFIEKGRGFYYEVIGISIINSIFLGLAAINLPFDGSLGRKGIIFLILFVLISLVIFATQFKFYLKKGSEREKLWIPTPGSDDQSLEGNW